MNNSNNHHLNILDLPDEILFIIFKKLNMIDVLYSLGDVNRRFDRLVIDLLSIRDLDLTNLMTISSLCNEISSIDTRVLARTCQKILPHVHHQVHQLTLEQSSMKEVLRAGNYPQLYSLSLLNFDAELLYQYLTADFILRDLLSNSITHLNIDLRKTTKRIEKTIGEILALILSSCHELIDLNFGNVFLSRGFWIFSIHLPLERCMSSSLIKLKMNVETFIDCLYLLDGRFDCLSTFIVNVHKIFSVGLDIGGREQLLKLKCFSLTTFERTEEYDDLIVPLLCRMINLEELKLYLSMVRIRSTYINGIQLYDQFLNSMTQLKEFIFNIKTDVDNLNIEVELPSNEDIQRSFIGRCYQQVGSYVHSKSWRTVGEYHIYSLPYDFEYFTDLNNAFQSGMFHKVRYLTMNDKRPFETKFFQIISRDFPCLQFLYINNKHRQKNKEDLSTVITFPYLIFLHLEEADGDYGELFLSKRKMHLPRLLNLCMKYKCLRKITKNFTNDAKHFNFGTLKSLDVQPSSVRLDNLLHEYFPFL